MNKKTIKILIPILIVCLCLLAMKTILDNPPKAKKKKQNANELMVQTQIIKAKDVHLKLQSYGFIKASTTTKLISQVSGKIVFVNAQFKDGAFIKKGDLLVQIEDTDYKADVQIAQANLILAQQNLIEEKAKAQQAKQDWETFNKNKPASPLVLRIPQIKTAQANLLAAQAQLKKAQLNLKRTKIVSPYDGRVITKDIAIAQVINSNTQVASVYESNSLEIRLPIKNSELKYLDLNKKPKVRFVSHLYDTTFQGHIVRSESIIDSNTKQLYFIATITNVNNLLNVGEYLEASIEANVVKNALIIPNNAIYENSYVYVEKNGIITRRQLTFSWQDQNNALLQEGLQSNENIVTTRLGAVNSGTKVKVVQSMQKKQKPVLQGQNK